MIEGLVQQMGLILVIALYSWIGTLPVISPAVFNPPQITLEL